MKLTPIKDGVKISYSSGALLRDVLSYLGPYKWRFLLVTVTRLIGDIVWLYPAFAMASLVTFFSTYEPGTPLTPIWMLFGVWAIALLIRALGHFIAIHEGNKIAERVTLDAQLKSMRHLFRLDMRWHEKENSGNKLKRVQNGSGAFMRVIQLWYQNVLEILVNFIGVGIIIFYIDTTILLFLFVFAVTFFSISFFMSKRAATASYLVNEQEEKVQGLQFEALNNIRSVKVMGISVPLLSMLVESTEALFGKIKTRIFRFQSRNYFLYIWGYGFNIGILIFIAYGIYMGRYEVGLLVLFHDYFGRIWASVSGLAGLFQEFITAKYSIARLMQVLDEPVLIDDDAGKSTVPKDWKEIRFENIAFSYGDSDVLSYVSFTVKRGEKVGIVGLSGAGKSTLFKLLLKEREEYTGTISFDDMPLKEIARSQYFDHVSAVLQDTEVFNLSLKDNVVIARGSTDDESLTNALEIAHVNDFLHKLPEGVDTLIGEKGVKLSGGERQRLGIARAVYKKPEILLLDEATSHLDLESEEKIQDSLHRFFESVTAIVIAHRLTTIKEMDTILVMEGGKIVEQGSFEELHARKGRFYELWEKQRL